ncbi:cellulose binding domain-containing protein [Streptomyces sp. NPDC058740]|uniref:cellulose binding domain-containing protein n=1 Tax=Streptomyces sp. NPDC058740 TaxID=3346619 RepID=UPI0036C94A5F
MGEFNVHNVDRALWWREICTAFEEAGGDGSAFWWYQDRNIDGKFGVFAFPGDQRITQMWNVVPAQDGRTVTASNPSGYNVTIAPGADVNFGFSGTPVAGTNGVPAAFTLNGKTCATA